MTEVYIKYNPYRLTTELTINGNSIAEDSSVAALINGKRLQKWIGALPQTLKDERGSREYKIKFHGNALDNDDVIDSFENALKKGVISKYTAEFEEAVGDNEVYEKILKTYNELMGDSEFTNSLSNADREGLEHAIKRVQDNVFPIHVIATMSSGKSTLINAMLRQKLMPSKNEACTAIITEILDNDRTDYSAIVYDKNNHQIKTIEQLTYEVMNSLNEDENITRVSIDGDVPFLNVTETNLKLVDTPGPNNSRNQNHRETTYKNINSAAENMILYILNYTQLATNDDENLLNYVAEEIQKGGKETRDRFLFVINKMDAVGEDDSVPHAIEITKNYLAKHGIEDPLIFPCSAFTALGLRTTSEDLNKAVSDPMAFAQLMEKPAEQKLCATMCQLNKTPSLHLEQYSTLSPSEQEKLRDKLDEAVAENDFVKQALIHSGIYSIESAIRAYVQKYAKAKKIRDFVEPLEAQLHQVEKSTKAKIAALSGGEEAKAIAERSKAITSMIEKGEEAKAFKSQIDAINPIPEIQKNAKKLIDNANTQLTKRFKHLGNEIEGRQAALQFLNAFSDDAAEVLSNLTVQMEVLIQKEVTETGTKLIEAYRKKLEDFDKNSGDSLDFGTADLVSGVLSRMKSSAGDYSEKGENRKKQSVILDEIHEEKTEYYTEQTIKMVKQEKEVVTGMKKVKVGEEEVIVGHHQEKVGSHKVQKSGLFNKIKGFFGAQSAYETVDDYEWFDDVEYRPIYDYVENRKKIIEEIPTLVEEQREKKKYVVQVDKLRDALTTPIRLQLAEGSEELIKEATKYMDNLKKQFLNSFDEVDEQIKAKYAELDKYTQQGEALEQKKKECVVMLAFINESLAELSEALNV